MTDRAILVWSLPHRNILHADVVRKAGLTKEQVWEAVKVAATIQGVAQAITTTEVLANA